jgi:hypothetical protein
MGKIDMTSNYWPLISEEKWRYPSLNVRCALDFQIAKNEGSWTCFCQWYSSQLSPEIYSRLLGLDLHVFCNLSKVNPFKKNMEAQQIDLVDVFSVAEGPLWVECLWRVECDSLKTPSQLLATAWRLVRTQVLWSAYGYGSKKRWFSFPFKRISSTIYRDITIFLVRWVEGSWFFSDIEKVSSEMIPKWVSLSLCCVLGRCWDVA